MFKAIKQWWLCRNKQCSYYTHYLAYGPADLNHDGYHTAAKQCDYWQRRWAVAEHEGASPAILLDIERRCEAWERRIRA